MEPDLSDLKTHICRPTAQAPSQKAHPVFQTKQSSEWTGAATLGAQGRSSRPATARCPPSGPTRPRVPAASFPR